MTIDEILTFIKANSVAGDWHKGRTGVVSHKTHSSAGFYRCPICLVATQLDKNPCDYATFFFGVIDNLGLECGEATKIAAAADNKEYQDTNLRKRLLEACRLPTDE
jgi:hypothetical protein